MSNSAWSAVLVQLPRLYAPSSCACLEPIDDVWRWRESAPVGTDRCTCPPSLSLGGTCGRSERFGIAERGRACFQRWGPWFGCCPPFAVLLRNTIERVNPVPGVRPRADGIAATDHARGENDARPLASRSFRCGGRNGERPGQRLGRLLQAPRHVRHDVPGSLVRIEQRSPLGSRSTQGPRLRRSRRRLSTSLALIPLQWYRCYTRLTPMLRRPPQPGTSYVVPLSGHTSLCDRISRRHSRRCRPPLVAECTSRCSPPIARVREQLPYRSSAARMLLRWVIAGQTRSDGERTCCLRAGGGLGLVQRKWIADNGNDAAPRSLASFASVHASATLAPTGDPARQRVKSAHLF